MKDKRRQTVLGALRLLGRYQPAYFGWVIPLIFVSSVIPLAGVWMPKIIIGFLTEERAYKDVLAVIGCYCMILMIAYAVKNLLTYKADLGVAGFKARLQLEIGRAAMKAKMQEIENAVYKEEILMAANVSGLSDIMTILRNLFSAAVTILGLGAIIVRVNLVFFLLVGFTLGLKIMLSVIRFRHDVGRRLEEAANNKVGGYLEHLQYYDAGAAKEVRVNNAQGWMAGKISAFRDRMVELQLKAFHQYRLFEAFQSIAAAVQNIVILLALAGYYMAGRLDIADFTLYFSAVTLLSSTLSKVTDQMFDLGQKLLACSDFNKVADMGKRSERGEGERKGACGGLGMRPRKNLCKDICDDAGMRIETEKTGTRETRAEGTAAEGTGTIRFENVTFAYPGTAVKVLENVSFELRQGDRAMLAGRNGSGKTTIIKLLCRFYRPDSGKIFVNGQDISRIPDEQYYKLIAAVFQDFSVFSFQIQENISMRPEEGTDNVRVWDCLEKAELESAVGGLKEKEKTFLTRLFSETGAELSGGEKQRLGIARALYKDARILVLDEPAANLDARMEEELYKSFYSMTRGKISLTVSHRLSQASVSNKILVLDHGTICETGTHKELMQKDGIYAAMFKKQREAYAMEGEYPL